MQTCTNKCTMQSMIHASSRGTGRLMNVEIPTVAGLEDLCMYFALVRGIVGHWDKKGEGVCLCCRMAQR